MMTGGEVTTATPATRARRSTTDELLAEAVGLARAVRELLVADGGREAACGVAPLGRLERAAKVGELTALLGFSVAWLLTRKAVETGELSAAEGRAADRRLDDIQPVAMAPPTSGDWLGRSLVELDGGVRALHARLARLDRTLDQSD